MLHPRFRQLGIAVALIAALALAGAQPGEARSPDHGRPTRAVPPRPGLLERARDWLVGALDLGPGLTPQGARSTSAPPPPVLPTTDAGPGIDPDGRH